MRSLSVRAWVAAALVLACLPSRGPAQSRAEDVGDGGVFALSGAPAEVAARFGLEPRAEIGPGATLAEHLGYAVAHSPAVREALAEWEAAGRRPAQVSALPDPRLMYEEMLSSPDAAMPMQERSLGISQELPWFGLLPARGREADAMAAAAEARAAAAVLRTIHEVRRAWWELAYQEAALGVAREIFALLSGWEEAARASYAAGGASYADLVRAQVELGMLEDRLAALEQGVSPLRAELGAALGLTSAAPTGPDSLALERTGAEGAVLGGAGDLAERPELSASLELAAMGQEEEARRHARTAAAREGYPMLMLGLEWLRFGAAEDLEMGTATGGGDGWMASLSLSLPIWRGKYAAMRREAAAMQESAAAARRSRRLELEAQLAQAVFEHRDAARRVQLYGPTLLPKGRQSLEAARAAYESGSADFLALIEAERVLLEFELSWRRALADRLIRASEIEMLTARPLAAAAAQEDDG